ncbi:MAG: P-II family nitrogen regulator [Planctomycetota bacterium]|jgi:nitrogen regulatory protein P-II 1
MRRVIAIVRPQKAEAVCQALRDVGLDDVLIASEVLGMGRRQQVESGEERRGLDRLPKVRIEVLIDDGDVEAATELISTHARTGRIGDGKLFVQHISAVSEF